MDVILIIQNESNLIKNFNYVFPLILENSNSSSILSDKD